MKKWQATLLFTSLVLGITQPIAVLATPNSQPTVTAQAATTQSEATQSDTTKGDVVAEGDYGVHWYLTAAGELHLGAGTLKDTPIPPTTGDGSNNGQLSTQIAEAQGITNPKLPQLQEVGAQVTRVVLDGPVATSANAVNLFAQFGHVSEYVNLDKLDTSAATSMKGMFYSDQAYVDPEDNETKNGNNVLTALDVSHFDTSHVTDMTNMFTQLRKVSSYNLSSFNTDQVTNAGSMFFGNSSLKSLDMSHLTFANLKVAAFMFSGSDLEVLRLDSFAPPANFTGWAMFGGKSTLQQLTLGPKTTLTGDTYLNDANTIEDEAFLDKWQAVGSGKVKNPLGDKYDTGRAVTTLYAGENKPSAVETYVWEPVEREVDPTPAPVEQGQPVTVKHLDTKGKRLAADQVLTGNVGEVYKAECLAINGHKLHKVAGDAKGTFTSTPTTVTFHYIPHQTTGGESDGSVPVNGVVYAKKTINLHSNKNFTDKTPKATYHKQKRANRPVFAVTGYATSKQGYKRYKVRDVNQNSKTAGKTGYITAKYEYVSSAYYILNQKKVKVLGAKGINGYKQKNLKDKVRHYKKGQTLKIKRIISNNKITRFQLTNGQYVTGNKKLVIAE
ncbi:hypothetical protein IV54_GL000458 [Levilactobacillus paucivorans]|uniref:BspA family leucine-rich repeat surface protein n=1 Tax=Levilactobacillus paucivorans TaxID=616990 RepID=A0A0R2M419_9LACO|nr:DUF5776 domain-containing protein [Levilactobacillus paucivorans]KRO05066.1 hypothetical protein IV54_GL000458 [Levilactobacillus paucivorans]